MRFRFFGVLLGVLLLAACAGQPTDVPTLVPPTDVPAVVPPTDAPTPIPPTDAPTAIPPTAAPPTPADATMAAAEGTLQAFVVPTMPIAGTMVIAPSSSNGVGIALTTLRFTQTGGVDRTTHTLVLSADGTLVRDGVSSTVSAQVVNHVNELLANIDFFNIQGRFTGPNITPATYIYSLEVETEEEGRTIRAQDGLIPPALLTLFGEINALGVDAQGSAF